MSIVLNKTKKLNLKFSSNRQSECLVLVGKGLIDKLRELINPTDYSNIFVVTDVNVARFHLSRLLSALHENVGQIVLPSHDSEKHIGNVQKIWEAMLQSGCNRRSLVINLGGGVVSDIGGFAASTFMRGVDFVNLPTTLLSAVDASVGGKTGINMFGAKNMIGTFAQPKQVIIDVDVLSTLSSRELIAGFGEVLKHGLIADKKYYRLVASKIPLECSAKELEAIIFRSCQIKSKVVSQDEVENGLRKVLNFGHTIGHAVESLSLEGATPILHGEAVAIGMCTEARVSRLLGLVSRSELQAIVKTITWFGLPSEIPSEMEEEAILGKMGKDKKNVGDGINFTLLTGIGQAIFDQYVPKDIILSAMRMKTI